MTPWQTVLAALGAVTLVVVGLWLSRAILLWLWAPRRPAMNPRRKIAAAIWDAPRESITHGRLDLDVTEALAYLAWVREQRGQAVTLTHLVGRVVGEAIKTVGALNGRLLLGAFAPHDTVDVSFLVALDGGTDVGQVKVRRIDEKPVHEIAGELQAGAKRLRDDDDGDRKRGQRLVRVLPVWALRRLIELGGWLSCGLGLELKAFGMERFAFGACMISNVGAIGLSEALLPMTPFARVPFIVVLGAIEDRPSVFEGQLAVRKRVTVVVSGDHRYADGGEFSRANVVLRELLTNPWQLEGLQGPPDGQSAPPDGQSAPPDGQSAPAEDAGA